MNLIQFKSKIVNKEYFSDDTVAQQVEIDEEHLSCVSNISLEIAALNAFSNETTALSTVSALLHDMYKTKTNKETHAKDASEFIEESDSLQRDLGVLFYEEFALHFTSRMLTTISCAVRNHKKMDGLEEYLVSEQMYIIALIVYAADKIDKFRTDADYSEDKFAKKMNKAYKKIPQKYSHVVKTLQPKIDIIKDNHKNDYDRIHT